MPKHLKQRSLRCSSISSTFVQSLNTLLEIFNFNKHVKSVLKITLAAAKPIFDEFLKKLLNCIVYIEIWFGAM